jgi:hypothetical protein
MATKYEDVMLRLPVGLKETVLEAEAYGKANPRTLSTVVVEALNDWLPE